MRSLSKIAASLWLHGREGKISPQRLMTSVAAARSTDDESDGINDSSFKIDDLFKADDKAHLTPLAVVEQLDRFIIGQGEAKVVIYVNRPSSCKQPSSYFNSLLMHHIESGRHCATQ